MNKKLILGLALAAGIGIYLNNKDNASSGTADPNQAVSVDNVFSIYDNKIVSDIDGFWFLIKDGKLFTPGEGESGFYASIDRWKAANPGIEIGTQIPISIWNYWTAKDYSKVGGTF